MQEFSTWKPKNTCLYGYWLNKTPALAERLSVLVPADDSLCFYMFVKEKKKRVSQGEYRRFICVSCSCLSVFNGACVFVCVASVPVPD